MEGCLFREPFGGVPVFLVGRTLLKLDRSSHVICSMGSIHNALQNACRLVRRHSERKTKREESFTNDKYNKF